MTPTLSLNVHEEV